MWTAVLLFTGFIYSQATAYCSWNVMLTGSAHCRLVSPLNLQTSKYFYIHCRPISGSAVLFGRFPQSSPGCPSGTGNVLMKMSVEHSWNDIGRGKTAMLGESPDPEPLSLPQISRGLTWDRNWASQVQPVQLYRTVDGLLYKSQSVHAILGNYSCPFGDRT